MEREDILNKLNISVNNKKSLSIKIEQYITFLSRGITQKNRRKNFGGKFIRKMRFSSIAKTTKHFKMRKIWWFMIKKLKRSFPIKN